MVRVTIATNRAKLQTLLDQILDLPDVVQSELLEVLLDARARRSRRVFLRPRRECDQYEDDPYSHDSYPVPGHLIIVHLTNSLVCD